MGEPVSILDLAEALITLSGLKPHEDIKIIEIGPRPGEKLAERLILTQEEVAVTQHPKIFINKISGRHAQNMGQALEVLAKFSTNGYENDLRNYLNELLPEANLSAQPNDQLVASASKTMAARLGS
jgi:FlaA1/EpsC-like NDP-sugar epimerase